MSKNTRNRFIVFAAAALTTGASFALLVRTASIARAQETKAAPDGTAHGMAADARSMAMAHADRMKKMAADPQQKDAMAREMARMMLMDRMAEQMARDPHFKQMSMEAMTDSNMMMVRDQAVKMLMDPDRMKHLQEEVMADPTLMKMVEHQAMRMATMADKMSGHGAMTSHGDPKMSGDKK